MEKEEAGVGFLVESLKLHVANLCAMTEQPSKESIFKHAE